MKRHGLILPLLVVEDVAAHLQCSVRSVHELVRERRIPHSRIPGTRRCLFRLDELVAWEDGCDLQVIELGNGGRRVKPAAEKVTLALSRSDQTA